VLYAGYYTETLFVPYSFDVQNRGTSQIKGEKAKTLFPVASYTITKPARPY
jgi:hypothetical protein